MNFEVENQEVAVASQVGEIIRVEASISTRKKLLDKEGVLIAYTQAETITIGKQPLVQPGQAVTPEQQALIELEAKAKKDIADIIIQYKKDALALIEKKS